MKEKHTPNFMSPPGSATWLEPKQCKDCRYRDKTTVDGRECGYSKGVCIIYPYPGMKPKWVMHNTGECNFYKKDERLK